MRKGSLIAMAAIVVVALGSLAVGQLLLKQASRTSAARVADVADVLAGTVARGTVTLRGIVDDVDDQEGCIYLRDVSKEEVCRDSLCVRAVIRVVTTQRPRIGDRAQVRGRISYAGGLPYLVAE